MSAIKIFPDKPVSFLFAMDGEDFSLSEIDAELAGIILKNLSQLIYASDLELVGKKSVSFKIQATPKGSFEFLLNLYEIAKTVSYQVPISDLDMQVTSLIAGSLGIIENGFGLIDLIIKLQGKEAKIVKTNKADVIVEGDNSGTITINKNVYNLYINPDVRTPLSEIFTAISNDKKNNVVEFRNPKNKKVIKKITSDEMKFFFFESKEEYIDESLIETKIRVIKPVYEGDSQWHFRYEGQPINAKILDKEWLNKFQMSLIEVPPGSFLKVTLKKRVPIKNEKIVGTIKYEIVEVKSVMRPAKQQKLI